MTAPHYADDQVTVLHGDCLELLAELPDASIDAVVTDPPYGIGFMGHQWDQPGHAAARRGPAIVDMTTGPVGVDHLKTSERSASMHAGRYDLSLSANAQFQEWCAAWAAECYRVLKPGGHFVSFGGSRTWHRLAAAVEDVGFEIRDSIAWLYGQGFPKSLDVSAAVDKLDAAAERRARALEFTSFIRASGLTAQQVDAVTGTDMGSHYTTTASQPLIATAEYFDMLRPYLPEIPDRIEHLVRERTVESENYKARRVTGAHEKAAAAQGWKVNNGFDADLTPKDRRDIAHTSEAADWQGWGTALKPAFEPMVVGRKPLIGSVAANVVAHGTGALNVDGCRVAMSPADASAINAKQAGMDPESYERARGAALNLSAGDSRLGLQPAAAHDLGRWPTNVVLQSEAADQLNGEVAGAARYFPTFHWEAKAPPSERPRDGDTAHPTVKPLDLMRWLVRLVTPPGGLVLDPFGGSGTTAEACVVEGFRCTTIEREPKYLPLIVGRLAKPIQSVLL